MVEHLLFASFVAEVVNFLPGMYISITSVLHRKLSSDEHLGPYSYKVVCYSSTTSVKENETIHRRMWFSVRKRMKNVNIFSYYFTFMYIHYK